MPRGSPQRPEPSAEFRDQAEAAALPQVDRDILLGVVADSHDFYRRQIHSSWVPNYLAQRRLGEAIESHQIGYAPAGWTTLTDHLRSLGYTDDHIEAAGMATRARTGQLIDRMRDRLIIPLRDHHGDLVAFTGRIAPHTADTTPRSTSTPRPPPSSARVRCCTGWPSTAGTGGTTSR